MRRRQMVQLLALVCLSCAGVSDAMSAPLPVITNNRPRDPMIYSVECSPQEQHACDQKRTDCIHKAPGWGAGELAAAHARQACDSAANDCLNACIYRR